jgi:polyhydroxyalkanoate synthase
VTLRPDVLETLKNEYMAQFAALWQQLLEGKTPEIRDRRFASDAWTGNPVTAFNAAAYVLNAKFLLAMVDAVDASMHQKQKIRFAVQQLVDAMSPANFLATNPEASSGRHVIEQLAPGHLFPGHTKMC